MKKYLILFIIGICAVLLLHLGGTIRGGENLTLAEAAYSVRGAETTDATRFLVGKFLSSDGSKLIFDGFGGLRQITDDYALTDGSYSLTEAADGAAVVRIELGGAPSLYLFDLLSPDGSFSLTDAAGNAQTFLLSE
jgi:hypothetical protein